MPHKDEHAQLVIPGPVEVRREILDAQSEWMIGHRSTAFTELFARIQEKLRRVFFTDSRVYVIGGSGTGLWEAAARNSIREGRKALHGLCGAFSERWAEVSRANGKQVDVIEVEWGQAITAEQIADALAKERYDAVCIVHNETSTGVINPIREIGEVLRDYEDTLFLVDAVSSFAGAELHVDAWGIDFALTSSQKALALPPGLAFAATSDRVLERARQVEHRGYAFDLLALEENLQKNYTPSTPPMSLLFAANRQLSDILAEGLEDRWARHLSLRERTTGWAEHRGLGLLAAPGYRSPTVTAVENMLGFDVDAMACFMKDRGFTMDRGYGKLKGRTFRIAHMGDMLPETLEEVLAGLDDFLGP